ATGEQRGRDAIGYRRRDERRQQRGRDARALAEVAERQQVEAARREQPQERQPERERERATRDRGDVGLDLAVVERAQRVLQRERGERERHERDPRLELAP